MVKIGVDFHYSSKKGLVNLFMLTQIHAYANYAKIKLKIRAKNFQNKLFFMSTVLHFGVMGCILANFRRHFFCKILKNYFGGFIGQNTR